MVLFCFFQFIFVFIFRLTMFSNTGNDFNVEENILCWSFVHALSRGSSDFLYSKMRLSCRWSSRSSLVFLFGTSHVASWVASYEKYVHVWFCHWTFYLFCLSTTYWNLYNGFFFRDGYIQNWAYSRGRFFLVFWILLNLKRNIYVLFYISLYLFIFIIFLFFHFHGKF